MSHITLEDCLEIMAELEFNQRCLCEDLHGVHKIFEILEQSGYGDKVKEFKKFFNDCVNASLNKTKINDFF